MAAIWIENISNTTDVGVRKRFGNESAVLIVAEGGDNPKTYTIVLDPKEQREVIRGLQWSLAQNPKPKAKVKRRRR